MTNFASIESNPTTKNIIPANSSSSNIPSQLTGSAIDQIPSVQSSNLSSPQDQIVPSAAVDFSHVTNEEFIKNIFNNFPEGASPAVCSKSGDPTEGGWPPRHADGAALPATNNNYISCSSYNDCDDGSFKVRKEQIAAYQVLLLDDLSTKIEMQRLGDFKLSWLLETSPGNFQGGIILAEPITVIAVAECLQKALIAAELCDKGATGLGRWARLPNAINGKEKYKDAEGKPFRCRLVQYMPAKRYSQQEIVDGLKLDLEPKKEALNNQTVEDVVTPKNKDNKVIAALIARGLYKKDLGSGKHDITCPWVNEHTGQLDDGAVYFESSEENSFGGFKCHHSHGDKYHIRNLLEFFGVSLGEASIKPVIRVVPGELERVVDTAERVLADSGKYYQAGGLIVSVFTNPATGDSSILPIGDSELIRQLSVLAIWEKPNQSGYVRCDPPSSHIKLLYRSSTFTHLPSLVGIARQPYFRDSDNQLVMESGYDKISKMYGVFDSSQYPIPVDLTKEAALSALSLLEDLLIEFHFVSPTDKAAALSAIFTSVVRPSLSHAPAFHVKAPIFGSGKSYLCELIGAFAGPGGNAKVSYPKTTEEATKVMLSLLLGNPAVIEFDDMDNDWLPHGVILRMLTAEHITERILGVSKTATVSTRSLFLGSGNNVGAVRDLLRRVLTIHIDPRCATPSTLSYKRKPLEKVRQQRGLYVAAVLTIILAWRKCGSPRTDAGSIVTYSGAWTDYCRQPLMWLGLTDPATALLEQVTHDPDAEGLGRLMSEWYRLFGSSPTAVRKVIETAERVDDLMDSIREFPLVDKGFINNSRFGWFLKRIADREVNGFKFQRVDAPQRTAWRVVPVEKGDEK
jgi:hypothetical protein